MAELNNTNQFVTTDTQAPSLAATQNQQELIAPPTPATTISMNTQVASQFAGEENKNRKHKQQLLIVGVILLAIVILGTALPPIFKSFLIKQYPEMGYIPELLKPIYPDARFGVFIAFEQNNSVKTSAITISAITKTGLTQSEIDDIGSTVCNSLQEHNTNYDEVRIESNKETRFLFFSSTISQGKGATCAEWLENKL